MNTARLRLAFVSVLALAALPACTGGRVLDHGVPVANATITLSNCSSPDFRTVTNARGEFSFNPFDPVTYDIHEDKHVPEGYTTMTITAPGRTPVATYLHVSYDWTCGVLWGGSTQYVPCSLSEMKLSTPPSSTFDLGVLMGDMASAQALASCLQRRLNDTRNTIAGKL